MITIQLIGGPDDGEEIQVDEHKPWIRVNRPFKHSCIYKRRGESNAYEFREQEKSASRKP